LIDAPGDQPGVQHSLTVSAQAASSTGSKLSGRAGSSTQHNPAVYPCNIIAGCEAIARALNALIISVDIRAYSSSGVDQFRQVIARLAHRELAHDRLEAYVSSRGWFLV
jgi:hypothetical protein